ncbi:DNA repair protein RecO [Flavobacterium oreochromis]|uniref:DNA repair protein RecO n=1 Tax=Flavobacterium columnare TaxID=996 RepID=A0A246GCS8_9FLAO|nr:DNA repair protein RecO [Flavobacterium oreochromis]OWP78945.1 DNA repair protein RecO [Flavobacterium oreochromis]POR29490.1 DNA repair protein RecO [Flavobacterium columnare]
MLTKTKAIVLSAIRYQEKSLIVKCFTETDGIKTYFVSSAYSAKKSNQKIAYFQPLTILDIVANHKNKGTLEHFKEIGVAIHFQTIPFNIVKHSIVLFLSEILHQVLKEETKNTSLYVFLETAIVWLDNHEEIANFHLIFLIKITKLLGFFPDTDEREAPYFDLYNGMFRDSLDIHTLTIEDTLLFKRLVLLEFSNQEKIFKQQERQKLLDILIQYYQLHLENFKKPKSLEVLKELFY